MLWQGWRIGDGSGPGVRSMFVVEEAKEKGQSSKDVFGNCLLTHAHGQSITGHRSCAIIVFSVIPIDAVWTGLTGSVLFEKWWGTFSPSSALF